MYWIFIQLSYPCVADLGSGLTTTSSSSLHSPKQFRIVQDDAVFCKGEIGTTELPLFAPMEPIKQGGTVHSLHRWRVRRCQPCRASEVDAPAPRFPKTYSRWAASISFEKFHSPYTCCGHQARIRGVKGAYFCAGSKSVQPSCATSAIQNQHALGNKSPVFTCAFNHATNVFTAGLRDCALR